MTDTQVTWLTQESHDRLKNELDSLIANRPVIAAEINERREEGDLKENGGYHAAREEQGQQEARIRQLQELLNTAKVMEDNPVALRMKELETLERVAERIDKISVFGGLDQVLNGLVKMR